jgi:hypothetical protein
MSGLVSLRYDSKHKSSMHTIENMAATALYLAHDVGTVSSFTPYCR